MSAACFLLEAPAPAQKNEGNDRVGDTRTALQEWLKMTDVISKERRDWALGRELLTARIDVLERDIAAQRQKVAEAEASIVKADEQRKDLVTEDERSAALSAALERRVISLETRIKALLKRLPEPILQLERVKLLMEGIPEDSENTKEPLGKRYLNVIGILNEIDKFNREITTSSEIRTLPDGTRVEVTAVYVGIGQGYYVNGKRDVAGVGRASTGGWTWTPANEAADDIAKVVAILKGEQMADYVKVPVRIK